jgi:hypothetical protein
MACLLVLLGAIPAGAQTKDLTRRWRTVRSEHFEVNYPEPLALVARRVLAIAERSTARLAPLLGHQPDKRVQIILTDEVDAANGSATPLRYNTIRLYVSAPDDLSVLSDFDDWLTILVTHEHAHILHLDNIGGLPAVINKIFGKVWAPNILQPRWIIEGIATYLESRETAGGRLRSTQYEMYMRMAVLEDNVVHFDTLNNRTDYWPHGDIWYLVHQLARRTIRRRADPRDGGVVRKPRPSVQRQPDGEAAHWEDVRRALRALDRGHAPSVRRSGNGGARAGDD